MAVVVSESDLIETYDQPGEITAHEAVEQYRRVIEFQAMHPHKKSAAASTALGLPRGRIRGWMEDGSAPDAFQGVDVALTKGWIESESIDTQRNLTVLLAGIFSGGGLSSKFYVPSWTVDESQPIVTDRIESALRELGAGVTYRHVDAENRSTEIIPGENRSVLGRVFLCLGAPTGSKGDTENVMLPGWLFETPDELREAFCEVYLRNRLSPLAGKQTGPVLEERSEDFRVQLCELLESISVEARVGDRYVNVSFDSLPFDVRVS